MKQKTDQYWARFGEPLQSSSYTGDLGGKYLFFSTNQSRLLEIVKQAIENHGFYVAKVSTRPNSGEYVLCLYWADDSRKLEVNDLWGSLPDIKYRWWKSNADTRAGKYSQKYLDSIKHPDPYADNSWDNDFPFFHIDT